MPHPLSQGQKNEAAMTVFSKITLLAAGSALALTTACTDTGVQTANPNQRAQEGAVMGAVAGAILGASTGGNNSAKRNQGAVIGAIVGGIAGHAIGADLDRQTAELQASMGDSRIQIINTGDSLIVRMPQDILFATDSASVRADLRSDLYALADNLQRYPNSTVEVVGHTDNTGSAAYNQDLSERRAGSVASILISAGVPTGRISAFGRGEEQPIATNLTAEGRAQNRRVDITIRPY
jgi:outer membrane protein OmpA-like peptidoglycan-associated protein